jgi:hypothetical protein
MREVFRIHVRIHQRPHVSFPFRWGYIQSPIPSSLKVKKNLVMIRSPRREVRTIKDDSLAQRNREEEEESRLHHHPSSIQKRYQKETPHNHLPIIHKSLTLPIQNLEYPNRNMHIASLFPPHRWPRLKDFQFRTKQVRFLFHFKLEYGWFAPQRQNVPDTRRAGRVSVH